MSSSSAVSNGDVIARIEQIVEVIVDKLSRKEPISIPLRFKKRAAATAADTDASSVTRDISFPGKTAQEAWRFTVLFRILSLIHEALLSGAVVSKRNIYYKDPLLFQSQRIVDHYVDVFAYTFGVPRSALNVTAAAKGLVTGTLSITRPDGSTVTKGIDGQVYLIDDSSEISAISIPEVSWILVVEKESSFRTLASTSQHAYATTTGIGIMITAKGYPDLSSRSFLKQLSISVGVRGVPPPIFAITDYDPDGIAIMSTYKHGSRNLPHENAQLVVPSIQWLGLRSQDVLANRGGQEDRLEDDIRGHDERGLLTLSARDRRKAVKMLENSEVFEEGGVEQEWRREVQVMLMLNVKAEMEILAERVGGLEGWVTSQLVKIL